MAHSILSRERWWPILQTLSAYFEHFVNHDSICVLKSSNCTLAVGAGTCLNLIISAETNTVFLQSDPMTTIFFHSSCFAATIQGQHLGKPTDINDGWIRYIRVRQWWLLDNFSSTCNLSVLLSVVGTTCPTQIALALAWWLSSEIIPTHLLAYTRRGYYLQAVFILFRLCSYYSKRWLFEGSNYSKEIWKYKTGLLWANVYFCASAQLPFLTVS